jgi:hypothetical protein
MTRVCTSGVIPRRKLAGPVKCGKPAGWVVFGRRSWSDGKGFALDRCYRHKKKEHETHVTQARLPK